MSVGLPARALAGRGPRVADLEAELAEHISRDVYT
jgi:hypothetical protein